MDKRDVSIGIMGICIIALVYALFFSLPSEFIIAEDVAVDIVESVAMWKIVVSVGALIVMFLYLYFSWHFSLGRRVE